MKDQYSLMQYQSFLIPSSFWQKFFLVKNEDIIKRIHEVFLDIK